jgi:5'-nucleotidase
VLEIWLLEDSNKTDAEGKRVLVDKEQVLRTSSRKYLIMCGEYMALGNDGYKALMGKRLVMDAESPGFSKSAIIQKFIQGT